MWGGGGDFSQQTDCRVNVLGPTSPIKGPADESLSRKGYDNPLPPNTHSQTCLLNLDKTPKKHEKGGAGKRELNLMYPECLTKLVGLAAAAAVKKH